eukprot:12215827-Alexandrium_andersonii.AAC.1
MDERTHSYARARAHAQTHRRTDIYTHTCTHSHAHAHMRKHALTKSAIANSGLVAGTFGQRASADACVRMHVCAGCCGGVAAL